LMKNKLNQMNYLFNHTFIGNFEVKIKQYNF
jgi:hypothetical protein